MTAKERKRRQRQENSLSKKLADELSREIDREVLIKLGLTPENAAWLTRKEPEGKIIKTF